jgi:hypothetical protein
MLRAVNYVGVLLCILWSLSPLGGQALLRVLSIGIQVQPLFYLDTSAQGVKSVLGTASLTVFMSSFSAIFSASLISPMPIQQSSMDNWGNVKIPFLFNATNTTSDGWISVPTDGNISYTSVLGTPIAGIPSSGNATFQVRYSYFDLDCQDPILNRFDQEFHWQNTLDSLACSNSKGSWELGGDRLVNNTAQGTCSIGSLMNNTLNSNSTVPREILFQSMAPQGIASTNCTVHYSTLDSRISCISGNCSVTDIRPASPPTTFTPLENCLVAMNFYNEFAKACGPYRTTFTGSNLVSEEIALASLLEGYIMTDASPTAAGRPIEAQVDLSTLTGKEMSERLSRVLNTYWTASIAPEYIAGGMSGFNFSDVNTLNDHPGITTNATIVTNEEVFVCDDRFLAVLLISSGILAVACGFNIWFRCKVIAPDVFGYISSLARDNAHFQKSAAQIGSTLDGFDLTKKLKDVRVALGDVEPGNRIGRVAFVEVGTIGVQTLQKGRLYR